MLNVGLKNEDDRKKWLKKVLASIPEGSNILDAGAGELSNKIYCLHLDYVSQDFCLYDGKGDESALQMSTWDTSNIDIRSDITSIPRPDKSFDAILCSEVLEHIPSPEATLLEFHRLLKQGGSLVLTAPFCSLTHFSPFHFSSGFNKYFYIHHLEKLGFEIVELLENGNFFEFMGQEVRRIDYMASQYSGFKLSRVDHFLIKKVLQLLQKLSTKDTGSKETLCFGYHVLAIKK